MGFICCFPIIAEHMMVDRLTIECAFHEYSTVVSHEGFLTISVTSPMLAHLRNFKPYIAFIPLLLNKKLFYDIYFFIILCYDYTFLFHFDISLLLLHCKIIQIWLLICLVTGLHKIAHIKLYLCDFLKVKINIF